MMSATPVLTFSQEIKNKSAVLPFQKKISHQPNGKFKKLGTTKEGKLFLL